ncbi:MAG: hypothetical protein SFV23_08190 [Planctomycetaceae bacterium]|nr:hypothetical protein [Planctomycetaceae bacterium]
MLPLPKPFAKVSATDPEYDRALVLQVYGNISIENPDVTIEMVEQTLQRRRATEADEHADRRI